MRFPSLESLARRAVTVLQRFPFTLLAGGIAATAAIVESHRHGGPTDSSWLRLAFVAALALPATVSVSLLSETRRWSVGIRSGAFLGCFAGLAAFFLVWPGPEATHERIRYFQLSAALHLAVAFLPVPYASASMAFWQYNRRLFLGFLRATFFSAVLFIGVAIAISALDHLFGVHVPPETYFRMWAVIAFVVNTWIFLAAIPEDLAALEHDREYPRALKVFAQYILTPLVFTYLLILLAYLVKLIAGAEWPSGWIGWLVASVSVTGLLGFLLVHPLRAEADDAWIRTYTRWLFIGLVPAAIMLLVAFWKRIVPYGLTEPRVMGLALGFWLLGIALVFSVRNGSSIRTIPLTLALLLVAMLYGPVSLTRLSIASQGRRLAATLAGREADEASAALRFLIEHHAAEEIATRIGHSLPSFDWATASQYNQLDSIGTEILALVNVKYRPRSSYRDGSGRGDRSFTFSDGQALSTSAFEWAIPVTKGDSTLRMVGGDSVRLIPDSTNTYARLRAGGDTLEFDLRALARAFEAVDTIGDRERPARLVSEKGAGSRRGTLALSQLSGRWRGDSVFIDYWRGWLLLGRAK
ncbi:MAG: DUF4153 domain-containing protein [Gemmatimonadota bacterium]